MPTVVIPFTQPILPRHLGGGVFGPRDPFTDSLDGYFQSEATVSVDGVEIDYSDSVDDSTVGFPSATPDGPDVALVDNFAFGSFMSEMADGNPGIVRLGVKQTTPAAIPAYALVDPFSILVRFEIVRRANYTGAEFVDFDSAGFIDPPPEENASIFKVYGIQQESPAFETAVVNVPTGTIQGLNFLWGHLREGVAEVAVGRAHDWPEESGVHEIRYIALVVSYELATSAAVQIQQTTHRDDHLAGGPFQTWPTPSSVQQSNTTFGGYL